VGSRIRAEGTKGGGGDQEWGVGDQGTAGIQGYRGPKGVSGTGGDGGDLGTAGNLGAAKPRGTRG
jgi:hypothetical protein